MTLPHAQTSFSIEAPFFKNFLQGATSLQVSGGSVNTPTWPSFLTANSLPTGTLPATIFGVFKLPSNVTGSETLVLAWTGTATNATGAMNLAGNLPGFTVTSDPGSVIKGSTGSTMSVSGTNGYVEFNFSGTPQATLTLNYLTGSSFSGMTKLIVCRKADYATVASPSGPGDLIGVDFINAWKALNPVNARMGGGYDSNDNSFTQWRYRPDWQSGIYTSNGWRPTLWVGSISGTNTYSVAGATDTPAAYTMGEAIQGYFPNASNAPGQTINVAGRGNVSILTVSGGALASNAITTNLIATLIYDDLLGGYLLFAGQGYGVSGGPFVALELLVAFCNLIGCNMWLNLPTHITTKNSTMEPSNSVTQLVSYVSSNLAGNFYLEYSNEVWNFSGAIGLDTGFAATCGQAFGFPVGSNGHIYGFYAYKVATIAPIARAAWTNPNSKLKLVLAFQAFGPSNATNLFRLQGTELASVANGGQGNATWISYTGNANYTTFPNRPVDLVDTLAYANYYSGTQCVNFDPTYLALGASKTITGISQANPGVITFNADPGYSTGQRVNIASVVGMTQVNGNNYSLTKLTATTYSMYTDATLGASVDTTGFTAYSSGGTAKSYPTISGLTSWADLYATGAAANIVSALSSLDADIQGNNNAQTTSALNIQVYPTWETVAAGYDGARPAGRSNLTIELYEGAFECAAPVTATCTTLGISTTYSASIATLIAGYKNSKYFYNRVLTVLSQFSAASPGRTVTGVWFLFTGGANQWSMESGADLYTTPYFQSYNAVKNINNGKRRLFVLT